MMTFLAFHGWGLSASFWEPLKRAMGTRAEIRCVDLGFIAPPSLPPWPTAKCVLVGHSLGFLCALRGNHPFDGFVSINGFTRFSREDDLPQGTDSRILRHMRARLHATPKQVRDDFLSRCGVDPARFPAEHLNVERLEKGLDWLADWDERALLPEENRLLALSGAWDLIVPPSLSKALFPASCLIEHPEGGHMLPITHPEWCADHLLAFAETLP